MHTVPCKKCWADIRTSLQSSIRLPAEKTLWATRLTEDVDRQHVVSIMGISAAFKDFCFPPSGFFNSSGFGLFERFWFIRAVLVYSSVFPSKRANTYNQEPNEQKKPPSRNLCNKGFIRYICVCAFSSLFTGHL